MNIQLVGVIGSGVMGKGIAQNLAQTGHEVILIDISQEILECAKNEIKNNIRLQCLFKKDQKTAEQNDVIDQITFSTDLTVLENADFVIENITEKWEAKKKVYTELDRICAGRCVFAANTSAIPITCIASATSRAPKVIGMHFMNPVPFISTVEVVRGFHTSDVTIEAARILLTQMGKDYVVVNDSPGFVSNRVLMPMINEAIYLLHEQVASPKEVDKIFKKCLGHKMGPLETADLIGLDTILNSIEVLYESFNDSKYRPCPLLKKMVDAGFYGRKNGQGFYTYPFNNPKLTNNDG